MADEQVGTVSVKAMPDTKGFRQKLKAELEKIEQAVNLELDVALRLNRRDLLQARREIKALQRGATVKVKLELDKTALVKEVHKIINQANQAAAENPIEPELRPAPWAIDEFKKNVRGAIDSALEGLDTDIPVELQDENLRADLNRIVSEMESIADVEIELDDSEFRQKLHELKVEAQETVAQIKLDADTKAAQQQLEGFLRQMRDKSIVLPIELDGVAEAAAQAEELARSRQLDIVAVLHAARAASQIAVLTHSRTLDVRAHLSGSSVGQFAALLAGLAGFRMLADISANVSAFVLELDRALPRLGKFAVGLSAITTAGIGTVGAVTTLATGIGRAVRGLLILPAAAAGVTTAFVILKNAFKDAELYIGDLGPVYMRLREQISGGYWDVAAGSVRRFTDAFVPLGSVWLPRIAFELGHMTEAVSAAVTEFGGLADIEEFFINTRDATDIAGEGIGYLTRALLDLIAAGSRTFPALAEWFNEWTESFMLWTARVTSDGTFERWMKESAEALRALGSMLVSTAEIFGAFAQAAENAGTPTLEEFAAALRDVADAANSARGLEFLTTLFRGANDAIRNMVPGARELGDAFVDLAPVLATVMELTGDIISLLGSGLADVLNNPVFQDGLVSFFEGIRGGLRNMEPAFETLGTDLGMVLETMGILAEALGEVLGVAAEELSTLFQSLMDIIQDLIPVFQEWAIYLLEFVGPALSTVIELMSDFVDKFPRLSAAVLVGLAAFGLLVATIGLIARPLVAAASGAVMLKGAFSALVPAGTGSALSGIASALGRIVAGASRFLGWAALLIGVFIGMWENSEKLRESVRGLWEQLKETGREIYQAVAPIFDRLANESLPQLSSAFGDLVDALDPVFQLLGDILGQTLTDFTRALEALTPAIVEFFETTALTIENGLEFISDVFEFWANVFKGDWEAAWRSLGDVGASAFDLVGGVLDGVMDTIGKGLLGSLDEFAPGWRDAWGELGSEAIDQFEAMLELSLPEVAAMSVVIAELMADTIGATLKETLSHVASEAVLSLVGGFYLSKETVAEAARSVVESIVETFAPMPAVIEETLANLPELLSKVMFRALVAMLSSAMVGAVELYRFFTRMPATLAATLAEGATNLAESVVLWFEAMKEQVALGITALMLLFSTVPDKAATSVSRTSETMSAQATNWFTVLRERVSLGIADVMVIFATLPVEVEAVLAAMVEMIRTQAANWFTAMASAILEGLVIAVDAMDNLSTELLESIADLPQEMFQAGVNAMVGFIEGMKSTAKVVKAVAKEVIQSSVDGAKEQLDEHSPSRVFRQIGAFAGEGYILGLEDRTAAAGRAALRMVAPPSGIGFSGSFEASGTVTGITPEMIREALEGLTLALPIGSDTIFAKAALRGTHDLNRRRR